MRWILLPALWIVTSLPPAAAQEPSVDQEGPTSLEPILIAAHERTIRGIAFSPDGSSIWTASEDGTAKEWSLAKRNLIRQLGERVRLLAAVAVSRDGKTVAICGRGGIQIWEPKTGAQK